MGKCKIEGMLQRDRRIRRRPLNCTGYSAKNTDFLRRIIAPNDGVGGVTLSYVWPHCHCFPLEERSSVTGGVQLRPVWLEAKNTVLGHTIQHGPPRSNNFSGSCSTGTCDKLINALKLLTNQRFQVCWREAAAEKWTGLRKFNAVDNHEAVKEKRGPKKL